MREIEQIVDFSKGIITSVDAIDIPAESCVLATNIEPNEGYIVPVKEPSTHTSTTNRGLAIKDYAFVVKDSTSKSFVCQDDTKLKFNTYSTLSPFGTDLTELGTYASTDLIPYNREARIAGGTGTVQKIFRHTDFQSFGMKDFTYTATKWNTDVTENYNRLYFLRGTPAVAMTVYVPLFSVTDNTLLNLTLKDTTENFAGILSIIKDYQLGTGIYNTTHTLSIAMFDADGIQEIRQIDTIDLVHGIINWAGNLIFISAGNVVNCFIFAGVVSGYNANPITVTKIDTTYKAFDCLGSSSSYTSIENGMYFKPRGSYETASNVIDENRRLNLKIVVTPAPYIYEDLPLTTYTDTVVDIKHTTSGSSGYFKSGTSYNYKFSLTFDGGQESLLSSVSTGPSSASGYEYVNVKLQFKDINSLSRRITGANIYRQETKDGISTFYRLIYSIDLTFKDTGLNNSDYFDEVNNCVSFNYADYGNWGASYEAISGINEEVTTITPKYTYGVIAYNRLLTVGNDIADESEAGKMLLISEPFKFDVFNWDTNQILLPSTPKGIGYFRDKVYVFGDNVIWKCNIDTLSIEDTYMGYQLLHHRSMLTTDLGLFFATTTGVFVVDGTNILEVSYPIRDTNGVNSGVRSSCKAWSYSTSNNRVYLYHRQDKNELMIFDTYTETGWTYNLRYKSWWYLDFGNSSTNANSCLIVDEVANIFWTTGAAIKKMFAGTNYAGATWISKLFTNGTASQKKRLYYAKHESENYSSNLTAYVDNSGSTTLTSDSNGNVTDTTYKTLQLKWANVASTTKRTIKDIEMIFRRMKGLR